MTQALRNKKTGLTKGSLPRRRFQGSSFFIPEKRAPLKTPAWEARPKAQQQIGHRKSRSALSARLPVVSRRCRSVAKSLYSLSFINNHCATNSPAVSCQNVVVITSNRLAHDKRCPLDSGANMVFFMAQSCSLTRNNNKTLYKPLPATAPPEHDHLLNESKKKSMSKICSNLFYIAAQFPGIACFQSKDEPSDGTSHNAPKPIRNQEDYFVFAFP